MTKAEIRNRVYQSAELRRLQRLVRNPHFDWNRAGQWSTVGFVLGPALMWMLMSL